MAKIIVSKIEKYPQDDPDSFAIGFIVECNNGRSFYIDTIVPFSQASTDEDALKIAYQKLKSSIEEKRKKLEEKSSLVGKELNLE